MSAAASPTAAASAPTPRSQLTSGRTLGWVVLGALAIICLLAPAIFTNFWLSQILTRALWLGIAAASLIFLSSYGGMVSLGQVGIYAIAGFTMANLVHASEGRNLGWSPWAGVIVGVLAAVVIGGFGFGAIAARSYGIYFLMITLVLSVIIFYFFGQVTQLSGFGGVRSVSRPGFLGNTVTHAMPLYYTALGCSVAVFLFIKYLVRTPFGIALQGIRDDPPRMRSLGYNVPLHRMLAFAVGAFIASIAGVLSVWYNTEISPGDVDITMTINVLVVAVIGGLYRIEGAWVGALFFALVDNYSRQWTPTVGNWLGPGRFSTIIGIIFLIIVLVSPGGLVGIFTSLKTRAARGLGSNQLHAGAAAPAEIGREAAAAVEEPAAIDKRGVI